MADETNSVFIDLLGVYTDLTPDILDIYTDLHGVPCDVYFPVKEDRLFSDASKVKYKSTPDISKQKYLLINIIRADAYRGTLTQFETFFNEDRPTLVTHDTLRVPPLSRIDAWFGKAKMSFRTEVDQAVTGVNNDDVKANILIKQILRPLS